jgi:hypothetical protein
MTKAAPVCGSRDEMPCEQLSDLYPQELLVLKELQRTGHSTNRAKSLELLANSMISESRDGYLQLTAKGRQMLVRGSPKLWDLAS